MVVVIDCETTGLSAKTNRIIELAAVRIENDEIVSQWQSLINPGCAIPEEITRITGITTVMVRGGQPIEVALQGFQNFVGSAPLVAHNAKFDSAFLETELNRQGHALPNDFACTLKLSKKVYPRAGTYSLQKIAQYVDLPTEGNYHRALADAMLAAELWLQIKRDLCAKLRLTDIDFGTMHRLQDVPNVELFLKSMK
jgi:DNA polymerase-3 subunit epsilon